MFIVFGWDSSNKPLESLLTVHCNRCETETHWTLWKQTTWGSLFFIKLVPIMDHYHLRCDQCGDTVQLDSATAKAALDPLQRSEKLHEHIVFSIQKKQQ